MLEVVCGGGLRIFRSYTHGKTLNSNGSRWYFRHSWQREMKTIVQEYVYVYVYRVLINMIIGGKRMKDGGRLMKL